MRLFVVGILLLVGLGCAGPSFTTRPVHSDPLLFVGLSSVQDRADAAAVRHDHPVTWAEADLRAILGRLLLQERGGLMDPTRPPRPVFSADEITRLLPPLRRAFEAARPADWVVFVLSDRAGSPSPVTLTSGALAVADRRLHVILANHRESVTGGAESQKLLQGQPLRPLKSLRGGLTFDPPLYVVDTRANWLGGTSGAAASELVLDHAGFLGVAHQAAAGPSEPATADSEIGALRREVSTLREELARLKHQLKEQAEELARLRSQAQPRKP